MTLGGNRVPLARPPLLVFLSLLLAANSLAQANPPATQHASNDVIILSLEALTPSVKLRQQVRVGLVGDSKSAPNVEKQLLEIQMNIVRETAKFGPVLLFAPDETTQAAVIKRCAEFQICDLLRSDRVRLKVVPHDGPWIRDFGPQIASVQDSAYVVHWRYFDIRSEEAKQERLQELEAARLKLLATRQSEDQPDALTQQSTPESRKAVASTIDDKLYLLREYTEILNEVSPQKTNDQNSAYDIADAVLAAPDFTYRNSALALDGGNLFKLDDGRCLTTRVLLSRNKDQNINVDAELQTTAGCKEITYLDPLPGPVIEHIDMFLLPVAGKRILLASYDLSNPFASEYWRQLSSAERDLALNAELAMESNAERLKRLGYEVILVPSPFPVIPSNGHTFYPSVLNALVRTSADGSHQLLVPSYRDYETDIQSAARKKIEAAFGPHAEIVPIESTQAAKSQGGVHCLTLSAPFSLSIFGDSADVARRTASLARKDQLDRSASAEIASQIPTTGLQGSWAILEANEQANQSPVELYPQRIFFSASEFQKGVFDQLESKGNYAIDKKDPTSWTLHFVFPDQQVTPAVVQWINQDEVKLIFADSDSTLLLRRINSSGASPFKGTENTNRSRPHKSATSPPQAPSGLQPVEP